ncbi:hypothetical protein PAM7971_03425 [Pacificibacter marinus]|uniref:Uncharacterized protein n=1 Tax=Pacificibacter marinus TaxID=658057 RepID=A0A1Y5TIT7_9RHOB|nr:hypothetical protein PAM7971_03425 [Pacificibacter marinus]
MKKDVAPMSDTEQNDPDDLHMHIVQICLG